MASIRERVKTAEDSKKQARIELKKLAKVSKAGGTVNASIVGWLMRKSTK